MYCIAHQPCDCHEQLGAGIDVQSRCKVSLARDGSTAVVFPPPLALEESFSQPGCGQIFPLFSRVMRDGLLTGVGGTRPGIVLSGPVFSGPVACVDLVNLSNILIFIHFHGSLPYAFC